MLLPLLTGLGSVGIVVAGAPAATAKTVTKQVTYTCQVAGVPGESSIGILLSVDVPDSVSPGEKVSIKGTITLRLPENVRAAAAAAELTAVQGYSDTVALPVTVGGKTTLIRTSRIQTPKSRILRPFTVSAPVSVPAFTVPAGATGEVVVEFPRNGSVANPKPGGQPAKVAFTAMSTVYGEAGSQQIGLFCYYTREIDRVIAKVPVRAAAQQAPTATTLTTPTASASASAVVEEPTAPAETEVMATTEATSVVDESVEAFREVSATGDQSREPGIFIPQQTLVAAGIAVVVVAVVYGVLAGRRARLLMKGRPR
ncbi:hypothetical protein BHE97_08300 [Aeromicrobium sp. PE09-221]|nr:hypothetical protein BHE97_08300 [Aeromicrobium sp. PE09-221]